MALKVLGVIPARWNSSRFPGKPLADIHGKPMIVRVYERAKAAESLDEVVVATDDARIVDVCNAAGIPNQLTMVHETGTDRVAEVAARTPADLYVNIQGDEPLLTACAIDGFVGALSGNEFAANALSLIPDRRDVQSPNTVKALLGEDGNLIALSRSVVPYARCESQIYLRQLGLYAFKAAALDVFRKFAPAMIERAEGVEMYRLIERGYKVHAVVIPHRGAKAVDTPEDLERVREAFAA